MSRPIMSATASSARSSRAGKSRHTSPEGFESLQRRNQAAEVLQSYETLSWYSFQRCEVSQSISFPLKL